MKIRRFSLIAISLFTITIAPAYADEYAKERPMVRTGNLQHVEFWHSRPQIRIEDEGPIVVDGRRRVEGTPWVVSVPPLPKSSGAAAGVPAGAVNAGGNIYVVQGAPGSIGNSNPMLGDRSFLPDAGPRSHITPHPISMGGNLPLGTSTGIHGQVKPPLHAVAGAPAPNKMAPGYFTKPLSNMAGDPVTFTYAEQNVSVGGKKTTHVQTSTIGKVLLNKMK